MRALNRKLLRDLATLKGQSAAIGVVIAAGVMTLLVFLMTLEALQTAKRQFYSEFHFAEVFADLKRAPNSVGERLQALPGVAHAETRIRAPIRLEVSGFADPVRGDVVSIPDGAQPELNRLYLRKGRLPEAGRWNEVAISEPFAQAHNLGPGDRLRGIIRGSYEELVVSGIALSPEFVYQSAPSDLLPDYETYAVLWMNRKGLANAFAMDGAFNNVVLTVEPGVELSRTMALVDRILERYGGIGAYSREDQLSHRFLSQEIDLLRARAIILPSIFLGVSAFLLHVLMGRIIQTQREQVAVLKAFGYRNTEIGIHYGCLTALIVLIGAAAGTALAFWAAGELVAIFAQYFSFPEIEIRARVETVLLAAGVAGGAAALGTWAAVRRAVKLPPAEAMRPPPPEKFRFGILERTFIWRMVGQPSRIILRNMSRRPIRTGLSVTGIGLSAALLVVGSYQFNAVNSMIDTQYRLMMTMDVDLTLTEVTSASATGELRHVPGTIYVEPYRSVPVRLRNGPVEYRTAILGTDERPQLRRLLDGGGNFVSLPEAGLVLTSYLADYLRVGVGEMLTVEVLEGHRKMLEVPLTAVVDEPVGIGVYMRREALNRLMREGPAISGAWLLIDPEKQERLVARLWEMPRVAGISLMSQAEKNIREYMDEMILIFMGILLVLAGSIAFAVVYNNARITLAERMRELATLRVLGFTKGEVLWILVGEIILITVMAIPIGWGSGILFALAVNEAIETDLFRIPFVLSREPFAFAAAGVIVSTVLAVLLMVRRVDRLDMVEALKSVE
ncbi:MAG TPA: FtsX-like permease family protein [Opitutales bacterium]|nr:FtsX-like permease family protein [Opitutales bacterium]